jgi:tRNA(fMet)-specific endonuclease VapC
MMYMLDTNICIDMIRRPASRVFGHIQQAQPGDIAISTITLAELECGVHKSSNPAKNAKLLIEVCSVLDILPFDNNAATAYGIVRSQLESKGMSIGPLDNLIAAHALSLDITLVTHNMKEFKRIKGLSLENWIRS